MLEPEPTGISSENQRYIGLVILFSFLAGTFFKIPELLGYSFNDPQYQLFYFKNSSFFILPLIALFFLYKNKSNLKMVTVILGIFAGAAILINAYPSYPPNDTELLTALHLPLLLWLITGVTYMGSDWRSSQDLERDYLIAFDFMLALVLGLVLCTISAGNPYAKNRLFDYLNMALIVAAMIIDVIALSAILLRLSAFGITPNKLAALGENLILLINLGGLAWLYARFFLKRIDFITIENWQTTYLYVYAVWLAIVAFIFPIVFSFN